MLPRVLETPSLRSAAFRFFSELGIRYRRSPVVAEGSPALRSGPRAGDRLPDAQLTIDGKPVALQRAVIGPNRGFLLCGDPQRWDRSRLDEVVQDHGSLIKIHYLSSEAPPGTLLDDGRTLAALGAENGAQYLVRPDGYIAFRSSGFDLDAVVAYIAHFFSGSTTTSVVSSRPAADHSS
jgi:hypothetical protein